MKNILINYYKKHLSTSNRELPSKMKAVLQKGIGGTDVLYIGEADLPELKDESEVLINVTAFALNRADILQVNEFTNKLETRQIPSTKGSN